MHDAHGRLPCAKGCEGGVPLAEEAMALALALDGFVGRRLVQREAEVDVRLGLGALGLLPWDGCGERQSCSSRSTATLTSSGGEERSRKNCTTDFYLATFYLQPPCKAAEAQTLLSRAAKNCVPGSIEFAAAKAELKALQPE